MMLNHVSRVMGERRLSIAETARRAGLAYTVVFGLYHDNVKRVDLETLDALCRALEVSSLADLIEYVPDERRRASSTAAEESRDRERAVL